MNTTTAASFAPFVHAASSAAAARRAAVLDGSANGIVRQRPEPLAVDFGAGAMRFDTAGFAQRRAHEQKMAKVRDWRDHLCRTERAKGSTVAEIAKRLDQFNASLSDAYRAFA